MSEKPGRFNVQVARVERIGDEMTKRCPTSMLINGANWVFILQGSGHVAATEIDLALVLDSRIVPRASFVNA